MENVAIYIRTKKAKEAERQRQVLIKYCKECDYNVVNTYVDYKLDKTSCSKSIIEMSRKKKFSRIVILNFDSLGNDYLNINLELDFLKIKGKDIEVVNKRKNIKIVVNDLIVNIKHITKMIFNLRYRKLHSSKYRLDSKVYNKYYYRPSKGGI